MWMNENCSQAPLGISTMKQEISGDVGERWIDMGRLRMALMCASHVACLPHEEVAIESSPLITQHRHHEHKILSESRTLSSFASLRLSL
jgi:hypothetical protein